MQTAQLLIDILSAVDKASIVIWVIDNACLFVLFIAAFASVTAHGTVSRSKALTPFVQ